MKIKTVGDGVLKDVAQVIIETDEDEPTIIAMISVDSIFPATGYRVRLRLNEVRSEKIDQRRSVEKV